jgi:hypothetical protein
MTTEATVLGAANLNLDRGPLRARRDYWATAVGANQSLVLDARLPREIYVGVAGDLKVTYFDGTTSIIKNIVAGTKFTDGCWVSLVAVGSTAYSISVGY